MLKDKPYSLQEINISDIDFGTRFRKDLGDISALASDISERGVIQPICVLDKTRTNGSLDSLEDLDSERPFLLLAGERRTRASIKAERETIPALVFERQMNEWEIRVIELHENIMRKEMTPFEKDANIAEIHRTYQKIYGKADVTGSGHSQKDTAKLLGVTRTTIKRALDIVEHAEAFPEIKEAKTQSDALKLIKEKKAELIKAELAKRKQTGTLNREEKEKNRIGERYITCDFFEGIRKLPDRSVDLIELDPDWGINFVERKGHDASEYQQLAPEDYERTFREYLRECNRVMKDHSWLVVWYSIEDWHDTTIRILEEEGFAVCKMPAFWIKGTGNTATPAYRMGDCVDVFLYARKGTPRLNVLGRNNTYHFRTLRKDERSHPAEKPVELYEAILETFISEGKVAVCGFAGSGNMLLAAANKKINAVGFDSIEKHKNEFVMKAHASNPGSYKSYKS